MSPMSVRRLRPVSCRRRLRPPRFGLATRRYGNLAALEDTTIAIPRPSSRPISLASLTDQARSRDATSGEAAGSSFSSVGRRVGPIRRALRGASGCRGLLEVARQRVGPSDQSQRHRARWVRTDFAGSLPTSSLTSLPLCPDVPRRAHFQRAYDCASPADSEAGGGRPSLNIARSR